MLQDSDVIPTDHLVTYGLLKVVSSVHETHLLHIQQQAFK